MIELSIIIVNWNCIAFTEQCIASIYENPPELSYEIIVVDNASLDAPFQSLVTRFPAVKLISSELNLGFGRANNLAVRYSSGMNLLFLNPDTLIVGDALSCMLRRLGVNPQAGALGCRLMNSDGSVQTTCVQRFPTISNQLLALNWLQRRLPSLPLWGKQVLYGNDPRIVHEVDVVSGAAILVKRGIFQEVGGFNPEYFMFAEEVELCHAIHRIGRKVLYTSDAQIIHYGGQSTKTRKDCFADIMLCDSVYRFFKRTRGASYAGLYRAGLLVSGILRLGLLMLLSVVSQAKGTIAHKQDRDQAIFKWRSLSRWSLGWDTRIVNPPSIK